MFAEEGGEFEEDGALGCRGEPVVFAGEDVELVLDVEAGQELVEVVGVVDGNDGVLLAVEDLGGREVRCGFGDVGFDEAAGEVDEAADFAAGGGGFGGGALGGEAEGKEAAEGYADERDACGVDPGAGGDDFEGGFEGVDPEGDVDAVDDGFVVGADSVGAVEVMWSAEGEAGAGDVRGDAG